MVANAILAAPAGGVLAVGDVLLVRICDQDGSWWDPGEWVEVQKAECFSGVDASEARLIVKALAGATLEDANTLLFDANSPQRRIRHGDRVVILVRPGDGSKTMPLWTGIITGISRETVDGVIITAADDRIALENLHVVGRYIRDESGAEAYQMGWPCHFNPGGRPNCLLWESGALKTWIFSPYPDYGLAADEDPPATPTATKAGYWTLWRILQYFRAWYYESGYAQAAGNTHWGWQLQWPAELEWIEGMGSQLDELALANFDQAVGQNLTALSGPRKGRDMSVEGLTMKEVFRTLFDAAGGWTLHLWNHAMEKSDGEYESKSVLCVVRRAYVGGDGAVEIPVAAGGNAEDTLAPGCVATRIGVEESSRGLITAVAGAGALHFCERRVTEAVELEPAWTTLRKLALLTYVGSWADEEGWREGCSQYPEVFSEYRLVSTLAPFAGTSLAAWSKSRCYRPPWTRLLSFLGQCLNERYEIWIEAETVAGWAPAVKLDGLNVLDNGIISLPVLRDLQPLGNKNYGNWRWTTTPWKVTGGMLEATDQKIRLTIAIPGDHRFSKSVGLTTHKLAGDDYAGAGTEINSPHSPRLNKNLKRVAFLDLGELYRYELRKTAWPIPESVVGAIAATDRDGVGGAALRDDSALLIKHVQRALVDGSRLDLTGSRLVFDGQLVNAWRAGAQVKSLLPVGGANALKPLDVCAVVAGVTWYGPSDDEGLRTEYVLA